MGEHVVKQGEYVAKIARHYGFADYRTIWNRPENAALREQRQNPNVLLPGDRLHIPDKQAKEEPGATQQQHRFQVSTQKLKLRLMLRGADDQPIANTPCELTVEGEVHKLSTDGKGLLEQEIPKTVGAGGLVVEIPESTLDVHQVQIKIGDLNPVEDPSGQIARLNNLGYNAGPVEGAADTEQFRSAVEEFQCDHGLTVDGKCGPATRSKLKEIHGC